MKFMILLTIVVVILMAGVSAQRRGCPQGARPPTCVGARNVGTNCTRAPSRRMWYFNSNNRTCMEMQHLGCGGNSNRFCSLRACNRRCLTRTL